MDTPTNVVKTDNGNKVIVLVDQELADFLKRIVQERNYQQVKWGDDNDAKNTINDWITYMTSYLGRVWTAKDLAEVQGMLVKVATLAAATYEWSIRGFAPTWHSK